MNITEDYISFEVAKLLKEKGFNEEIETLISPDGKIYHCDERSVFKIPHKTIKNSDINVYIDDCSCPTLQMTMKWLREMYGLMIVVHPSYPIDGIKYESLIYRLTELKDASVDEYNYDDKEYDNYEQACESAIKYCIENLI